MFDNKAQATGGMVMILAGLAVVGAGLFSTGVSPLFVDHMSVHVDSVTSPLDPGETGQGKFTFNATTQGKWKWTVRVAGDYVAGGIEDGMSWSKTVSFKAPTSPGTYKFKVTVEDVQDVTYEDTVSDSANFTVGAAKPTYDLTISVSGQGTTSPSPGTHTYEEGTLVKVTATADSGWKFDRWSGARSSTSNEITVTMDEDKSITANFEEKETPTTYGLSTNVSPYGAGSVSLSPSGGVYEEGTEVDVTATAASGYEFDHWSGDASGTSKTTTVTMDSDKSVTANFIEVAQPSEVELTTSVASGEGTITPSSGTYAKGEEVTIEADPSDGYQFERWGGDASGSENPTTITMDSNKHVEAYFKEVGPEQVTVTLRCSPPEGGSITLAQSRQVSVDKGTVVSLQAFSNSGYAFDHWSGDVSGTDRLLRFTANEDSTIIANFKEIKTPWDVLMGNLNIIMMALGSVLIVGGVVVTKRS